MGARAERTRVDTPPTGRTKRTSFPPWGEYARGTSCLLSPNSSGYVLSSRSRVWFRLWRLVCECLILLHGKNSWGMVFTKRLFYKVTNKNESHSRALKETIFEGVCLQKHSLINPRTKTSRIRVPLRRRFWGRVFTKTLFCKYMLRKSVALRREKCESFCVSDVYKTAIL